MSPTKEDILVVVPCLDEASHIAGVVTQILSEADGRYLIAVVDGGSVDGTREIVAGIAGNDQRLVLLANEKRIQSAAVNKAVASLGSGARYLIRIDAHAYYPRGYCETLVAEAISTGADSVVVAMVAKGTGCFQTGAAAAQNSPMGNGGSLHRSRGGGGRWVDHGHHALMRIEAFRAVGGYDETFTHNEDAELDFRLGKLGCRIWLTNATSITYLPRTNAGALFKQYVNYGKGRARTLLTHGARPKLRQCLPIAVLPAVIFGILAPVTTLALMPLTIWLSTCIAFGVCLALRARNACVLLSGPAAIVMHLAWSLGFWCFVLAWRRQATP